MIANIINKPPNPNTNKMEIAGENKCIYVNLAPVYDTEDLHEIYTEE